MLDDTEYRMICTSKQLLDHACRTMALPDQRVTHANQMSFRAFFLFCSLFLAGSDPVAADQLGAVTGTRSDVPRRISPEAVARGECDEVAERWNAQFRECLRLYEELRQQKRAAECTHVYEHMSQMMKGFVAGGKVISTVRLHRDTHSSLEAVKVAILALQSYCMVDYGRQCLMWRTTAPATYSFDVSASSASSAPLVKGRGPSQRVEKALQVILDQFSPEVTRLLVGEEITVSLTRTTP